MDGKDGEREAVGDSSQEGILDGKRVRVRVVWIHGSSGGTKVSGKAACEYDMERTQQQFSRGNPGIVQAGRCEHGSLQPIYTQQYSSLSITPTMSPIHKPSFTPLSDGSPLTCPWNLMLG